MTQGEQQDVKTIAGESFLRGAVSILSPVIVNLLSGSASSEKVSLDLFCVCQETKNTCMLLSTDSCCHRLLTRDADSKRPVRLCSR